MKRLTYLAAGAVAAALSLSAVAGIAQSEAGAGAGNGDGARAESRMERAEVRGQRGGHGPRGGFGFDVGGGRGEMMRAVFAEVDADGDGAVTQAEVDAWRDDKVAGADASGDGALSIEEFDTLYRDFTRSRMVDAFQNLDADGDGVISQAEMDARFGDVVERMDRDEDGALTLQRGRRG